LITERVIMVGNTLTRDDTRTTAKLWRAIQEGADGVTVDTLGGEDPRYGYFVGGASWTLVKAVERVTPDDVAGFVSAHGEHRYIGMWVDAGRVYLDAVDLVYREADAFAVGRERRELTIFNVRTRECEAVS